MPKIETLTIEPRDVKGDQKKACIQKILDAITGNYTDRLADKDLIGEGTFAVVYKATRRKKKDPKSTKDVAVRILVTDNEKQYKREKKPATFFSDIKKIKDRSEYNEIKKYISIPKLKYDFTIHLPNGNTAHGLVFESELATSDISHNETQENRVTAIKNIHNYIRQLIIDVANAIEKLHSTNHLHNDIKPDNILMTIHNNKPEFKLTDLGQWCKKRQFEPISDDEKDILANEIYGSDDPNSAYHKFINTDPRIKATHHLKRCLQNLLFSSPEKQEALDTATTFLENLELELAEATNFALNDLIDAYNNLVDVINNIDEASDMYSFGKSLALIANNVFAQLKTTGSHENFNSLQIFASGFKQACRGARLSDIQPDNYDDDDDDNKGFDLKRLITSMIHYNKDLRPTPKEIQNDRYLTKS